jgi:hypothetical protein
MNSPASSRRPWRPAVEPLEDRLVLDGTFTVNDTNPSSLSSAITQAENAGGGTIVFATGVTGTIQLAGPLPDLTGHLTIQGPGANVLTVRGDTSSPAAAGTIFIIDSGATVSISGLTITNGVAPEGGGVNNNGTLTLDAVTVDGNSASGGGGIENFGTLTVRNSTVSNNTSLDQGAGGIDSEAGTLTVVNSTISGNQGGSNGGAGGIAVNVSQGSDTAFINNSTITNNTGGDSSGGGIDDDESSVTLFDTIVANNSGGNGADVGGSGITSAGHNLIGLGNGSFTAGTGDQVGSPGSPIDPMLGPLADNGGPTKTHLPHQPVSTPPFSPVIGMGDPTGAPASDQRGLPRTTGGKIDIGAVESASSTSGPFVSQIILTTSPAAPGPGQPFMVTAAVGPLVVGATSLVPGGNVDFTVNGGSPTSETLNSGLATFMTSQSPGSYTIAASFPGDSNFTGSTDSLPVTVSNPSPPGGGGGGGAPQPVSPPQSPTGPPVTPPGGSGPTVPTPVPAGPRGPEKTRVGEFVLPAGVREMTFETVATSQGQREILVMDATTGAEILRLPVGKGPGDYRVLTADLNGEGMPDWIFYSPRKGKVLVMGGNGKLLTYHPFGRRFKGRLRVRVRIVNGVPQVVVSTGQGDHVKATTLNTQAVGSGG